jgi:hypothetical protein
MTDKPVTIESLIALAISDLDEWVQEHPGDDPAEWGITQVAEDNTPAMTTVLFGLVVQDNSLAFADTNVMSSEPFAVLSAAVKECIEAALEKHIKETEAS